MTKAPRIGNASGSSRDHLQLLEVCSNAPLGDKVAVKDAMMNAPSPDRARQSSRRHPFSISMIAALELAQRKSGCGTRRIAVDLSFK
jgi:hypothetical protein